MNNPMQKNRKETTRNRLVLAGRIAGITLLCAAALAGVYRALGGTGLRPLLKAVYRVLGIHGSNPPAALNLGLMLIVLAEIPFMFPLRKTTEDEADESLPED